MEFIISSSLNSFRSLNFSLSRDVSLAEFFFIVSNVRFERAWIYFCWLPYFSLVQSLLTSNVLHMYEWTFRLYYFPFHRFCSLAFNVFRANISLFFLFRFSIWIESRCFPLVKFSLTAQCFEYVLIRLIFLFTWYFWFVKFSFWSPTSKSDCTFFLSMSILSFLTSSNFFHCKLPLFNLNWLEFQCFSLANFSFLSLF